ncbi:MAG: VanZ family protein [Gammaproteobacteria bacterium]|jgi:VanZ family protein
MPASGFYYRNTWLIVGAFLVLATIAGSLAPNLPEAPVTLNDKFLHLFVYGVLGSWFGALISSRWWVLLALLVLGLSLEFFQALGGSRHAEVLDMLANTCGALVGVMVVGRSIAKPLLLAVDHFLAAAKNPADTAP